MLQAISTVNAISNKSHSIDHSWLRIHDASEMSMPSLAMSRETSTRRSRNSPHIGHAHGQSGALFAPRPQFIRGPSGSRTANTPRPSVDRNWPRTRTVSRQGHSLKQSSANLHITHRCFTGSSQTIMITERVQNCQILGSCPPPESGSTIATMKLCFKSLSKVLRRVAYSVEPFGFNFVPRYLPPPLLDGYGDRFGK